MSVQAAVAFLNGNDTSPNGKGRESSNIVNRPSLPKTTHWTTSKKTTTPTKANWNTKTPNLSTSKKDESLTRIERTKPPVKTESIAVKTVPAISSKPTATTTTTNTTTTAETATTATTATTAARNISKRTQDTKSVLDKYVEEMIALYQEVLDNYNSATVTITKLEADVEIYVCDSTKVRDYEIRIEYLAQKLEQVSEERDLLEQELATYKDQHLGLTTPIEEYHPQQTPSAPINMITKNDNQNSSDVKIMHEQQVDDAYYDEILGAYEEHQSQGNQNNNDIQQKQNHEQMVLMEQMLAEYDQGMKMAMETYVADLEKQRLENKTLQSMVKKQDELIKKLENQCNNSPRPSSHHIKLTTDQQLHPPLDTITQQSNKYNDRTKNINNDIKQQRKYRGPSYRSSIDVLEEIAKTDSIPTPLPSSIRRIPSPQPYHYHHHQRDTGRSTPPPFAPPRTPLPPLPTSNSSISLNNDPGVMTSTRGSLISYSRSSTSSTSWSSDEQHQHHHPLSNIVSALPLPKDNSTDDGSTNYSPLVKSLYNTTSPPTSGSFWKGLKKKF